MTDQDTHLAAIGDNMPPPYSEAVRAESERVTQDALARYSEMARRGEITNAAHAEEVSDVVGALRAAYKAVDASRAAEKKPHDDAAKAVQRAFTLFLDAMEKAANGLKDASSVWLQKEKARLAAEKTAREAEAQRLAQEAFAAAALAAARGDAMGAALADQMQQDADTEAKRAASFVARPRIDSATGAGRGLSLRTTRKARIFNANAVYMWFRDHPDVRATLQRLADEAVRSKDWKDGTIAGMDAEIIETAA